MQKVKELELFLVGELQPSVGSVKSSIPEKQFVHLQCKEGDLKRNFPWHFHISF